MARKKIVILIVEGLSDKQALSLILSNYLNPKKIEVVPIHGDITTRTGVNENNIVNSVCTEVKKFIRTNTNGYIKSDIDEVIHLTDTDCAFIPDSNIIVSPSATKYIYTDTNIECNNKLNSIKRNLQKSKNINKLITCKKIWKDIPYCLYFMSCNLDHVLYNKRNLTDEMKEKLAHEFSKQYKDDTDRFIKFMQESDFAVMEEYDESWNYIKNGLHSLERHSNFGLYFKEKDDT